ncbi:hypothetical protein ACWDBW_18225 [Streptomyces sp. NPDC001107]
MHQVFRGVFEDWQAKAGVLSATPGAPVVPDESRRWRQRLAALTAGLPIRDRRRGHEEAKLINPSDSDTRRRVHPYETSMPPHIG